MFAQVVAIGLFATMALAQGEGLGYPPPPAQTLTHTMSGVLPVLPPGFTGVAVEEGAIIYEGPSITRYAYDQVVFVSPGADIQQFHASVWSCDDRFEPPSRDLPGSFAKYKL